MTAPDITPEEVAESAAYLLSDRAVSKAIYTDPTKGA